ncbi:hypothetical protein LSAT2_003459 [Lamellibrachia satsuma]|nr:hypothetical protein LSAT2_003459 [Lamellibrachia satsuma]
MFGQNACLVLFLVSVALHGSNGENALGENCTSSSDCDYSHGRCVKYDQCEMGMCGCDYGYAVSDRNELCQKLKEIGDRCDVIEDKCYAGSCKGVCTCGRDRHASDDKKQCVGNVYGEPCDTNTDNDNYRWKINVCEDSKGLQCDQATSKCVCRYGMKHVGDHCEKYKLGEPCSYSASDRKTCEDHLSCVEGLCACSDSDDKEYTVKVRDDGVETEYKRCVDKEANLNAAESAKCNGKTYCGDYLTCRTCIEWPNQNDDKCLSGGADSQRTNAAVSLGLVLVAFFAMLR